MELKFVNDQNRNVFLKAVLNQILGGGDADSRMGGIFIRDTACYHCFSMNCDSFSESQRKHGVSRMKMPPVRESASSPVCLFFSVDKINGSEGLID